MDYLFHCHSLKTKAPSSVLTVSKKGEEAGRRLCLRTVFAERPLPVLHDFNV
nr:MAG TPA_asm: hypothetical protein [Caudoviricetes sp.]